MDHFCNPSQCRIGNRKAFEQRLELLIVSMVAEFHVEHVVRNGVWVIRGVLGQNESRLGVDDFNE